MGLLDIFKKKEQINEQIETVTQEQTLPYDINLKVNEEGKLQVDFHDKRPDFKEFYDTTRLIIDSQRTDMGSIPLKECRVSWYGESDMIMIDRETGEEISRRTDYKDILTDIDIGLLQTDYNYCVSVMKNLVNQKRVEKYLNDGLKENPEVPCGKYIGGIRNNQNKYEKYFDQIAGQKSHNSNEMIDKRNKYRELQEIRRQQQIKMKREEMAKLQSEIDDLSR